MSNFPELPYVICLPGRKKEGGRKKRRVWTGKGERRERRVKGERNILLTSKKTTLYRITLLSTSTTHSL